jgi:hypothetical protein
VNDAGMDSVELLERARACARPAAPQNGSPVLWAWGSNR